MIIPPGVTDFFKPQRFSSAVFNVLFVIVPGFAIIFVYYRDLFATLDLSKLIILSITFSTPFILLNFFASQSSRKIDENQVSPKLTLPIFISVIVVYLSLLIAKIFNFDLSAFSITVVSVEFLAFILGWIFSRR